MSRQAPNISNTKSRSNKTLRRFNIIILAFLLTTSCNQTNSTFTTPVSINTPTPAFTLTPSEEIDADKNITPVSKVFFDGQVSRGQKVEYEISETLIFRLEPRQFGWDIWIGSKMEPLNNYVGVVTPPYHGMNAIHIEGWHFRNSDNSGPNESGPKLVNAPQKERRFYFILNEADYQIAYNSINDQLLSSDQKREQIREKREQLEPREGLLNTNQFETRSFS